MWWLDQKKISHFNLNLGLCMTAVFWPSDPVPWGVLQLERCRWSFEKCATGFNIEEDQGVGRVRDNDWEGGVPTG